jgi:hypothetical protein
MIRKLIFITIVCAFVAAPAWADLYGFYCITNDNPINAAIGEAQLTVDVTSYGTNQVLFTFLNAGPQASSIADIYFDDGTLLALADLIYKDQNEEQGHPGVDFTQEYFAKVCPPDLPGGGSVSPEFQVTGSFKADSDPPVSSNGVGPGEYLGIIFNLQSEKTLADVLDDLASRALRIGIHVQSFPDGGSESFINNPYVVPVPEAILLGMLGLSVAGLKLRKYA